MAVEVVSKPPPSASPTPPIGARRQKKRTRERGGGGGWRKLGNLPTCCSHLPGSALIGRARIHFFSVFLSSEQHSGGTLMRRLRRSLPFSAAVELIHAKQTGAAPSPTCLGTAVCSASVCFNGRDKFVDNTFLCPPAFLRTPLPSLMIQVIKRRERGASHLISPLSNCISLQWASERRCSTQ